MKILTESAVFIQKKDLNMLLRFCNYSDIPTSILEKHLALASVCNDTDCNEFIKFDKIYEIEFFKNLS